jgi:FKBP-type peptidyl-prolyl cis-trans isomerase FklB
VDAGRLNIETSKVGPMVLRACALFLLMTTVVPVIAQDAAKEKSETPKLETTIDKASYAIGYNIGKDILKQGLEPNPEALAAGIAAALAGEKSVLTSEEIQAAFKAMQGEMQKKAEEKAAKNLEAGKAFLVENKAKEGVKVTKSGLQYIVLKEGTGAVPTKASTVSTHYRGKLIDGTVFDNSYEGDEPTEDDKPASFGVTQVIKGWTEALQLMKVGAKYRLFLPSELAYGENGPPGIGPNSVLIFDIELVASEGGAAVKGESLK